MPARAAGCDSSPPSPPLQLCRGATAEERERYRLPPSLDAFAYLAGSGCTEIPGVDDAAQFAQVKSAMAAVGIDGEQQAALFSVLAAVLWLGNVAFTPLSDDAVAVDPASLPALRTAAALLGVGEAALCAALTSRQMVAGGEAITRDLSLEAALDARDALAKATYAAAFRWLVERINGALAVGAAACDTTLSILDIYGALPFLFWGVGVWVGASTVDWAAGQGPRAPCEPACLSARTCCAAPDLPSVRTHLPQALSALPRTALSSCASTWLTSGCSSSSPPTCSAWSRACTRRRASTGRT